MNATKQLGQLFRHYGTDKAVSGYHEVYGPLLGPVRDTATAVCEVGIGTLNPDAPWSMAGHVPPRYRPGGSLRAWRDFFPNATIWGVDVMPDTMFSEDRIITVLADSTNWVKLQSAFPSGLLFDLIVDDGDHSLGSQILTLTALWSRVKLGGLYVVEDRKQPEHWLHQFNACINQHQEQVVGSMIVYRKPVAKLKRRRGSSG